VREGNYFGRKKRDGRLGRATTKEPRGVIRSLTLSNTLREGPCSKQVDKKSWGAEARKMIWKTRASTNGKNEDLTYMSKGGLIPVGGVHRRICISERMETKESSKGKKEENKVLRVERPSLVGGG